MDAPPLNIECITWNAHGCKMATIDRKGNVGQLFDKRAETDIYVISLQEIVPLDIDHILFDFSGNIECTRLEWTRKMLEYANANPDGANVPFEVLSSRAIVGTFLLVLIKSTHRSHVQHKQDQDINLYSFLGGLLSLGNKAACVHRFQVYGKWFCLASVHLAAHRPMVKERIEHVRAVLHQTCFVMAPHRFEDHDFCFFVGDMNWRIVESFDAERGYRLADDGSFLELAEFDQLNDLRAKKTGVVFRDWCEAPLSFTPSYKLDLKAKVLGGQTHSYKVDKSSLEKYVPAWTDRVLYKCAFASCVRVEKYTSIVLEDPVSDHFPVKFRASLNLPFFEKERKLMDEEMERLKKTGAGTLAKDAFGDDSGMGSLMCGTSKRVEERLHVGCK
jgi:hypothetical protein